MAEARRNFRTFCRFVFCFAQTTEPNQVEDTVVGRAFQLAIPSISDGACDDCPR
jgi:hypothetical protein